MEIFSTYGKIKMIDVPVERMHPHLSTGYAYVECENPDGAEKALKHADGGHIDGQQITAAAVLAPWPRPPPRRFKSTLSGHHRTPPPPAALCWYTWWVVQVTLATCTLFFWLLLYSQYYTFSVWSFVTL
uniref:RRM domain-containing protein n=1 Tax=Monodon monoceros TaxID=40151 RepID=A0A8C6BGY7_MONMO